jgi:hypothetical protein
MILIDVYTIVRTLSILLIEIDIFCLAVDYIC